MSDAGGQKSEVTRTGSFAAGPTALWGVVSDFGGLDKVVDGMDPYETKGEGVGAVRSLPMGGGMVVERLDVLDQDSMTLTYSIIDSPLPFKDYSATMIVAPEGESGSSLTWTGTFEADGAPVADAEKLAGNIYSGGIAAFSKALDS